MSLDGTARRRVIALWQAFVIGLLIGLLGGAVAYVKARRVLVGAETLRADAVAMMDRHDVFLAGILACLRAVKATEPTAILAGIEGCVARKGAQGERR